MKGVEYSLDKTLHRIASNLQINNCCRHFSAVRTSCFLLKYQVFADSERVELRDFCNFFEDVVMLRRLLPDFIPRKSAGLEWLFEHSEKCLKPITLMCGEVKGSYVAELKN